MKKESSGNPLIDELEALKGPHAKIMGYDYYNVMIATCSALVFSMAICWFVLSDDPQLRKMVLGQGALSLCLIATVLWFKSRLPPPPIEEPPSKSQLKK